MKTNVHFKNIETSVREGIRNRLAELVERHLHTQVASWQPPPELYATLEQQTDGVCSVGLRLSVGGRNLIARDRDADLVVALNRAAESLEWRVRRFGAGRRWQVAENEAGQQDRWQALQTALQRQTGSRKDQFARAVVPRIELLAQFVERELAYLQAEDRLAQDYPTATDVLDEVLVRALDSDFGEVLEDATTSWLQQLVIEVLTGYAVQHRARQLESVSLNEQATELELDADPVEDGWLDEKLRLEDLVPSRAGDAFESVSATEVSRQALTMLRRLPTRWRRVVSFHYLDELPIETIAETLRMPRDEVRAIIDAGVRFLGERLREQDIEPAETGWPGEYLVAPPSSPVS